ncbi:MAG: glycoside hydrolase family 44 protein [Holophagaceae bacterium]
MTGATGLTLDQGIGAVTGTSFGVAPAATTTYTLSATNAAGTTTAAATVTVLPPAPASCSGMDLGVGADLKGTQVFAASSAWNQDISGLPVDPNSATLIATIGASKGLKGDYGAGLWAGGKIGIPYVVVSGQPKVPLTFTAYGDESDPGPYPVPPAAPIEGDPAVPNDGDRHVLVLDRDTCTLYELYRAFPVGGGTSWKADSAAVWDLKGDTKRPLGWTSADAAGLPVFPGLVRYDEAAAGQIRHALRFTANLTRKAFTPPATHWASSSTDPARPPMGMRVRLKAGYDISGFSPTTQAVLQALKTYGMILADNGSDWYISGAPDDRWNNSAIAELSRVKGSDLEVVKMGTIYTSVPAGTPPAISAFTASPATLAAGQTSTLSFTVTGASTVIISPEVGVVTGGATAVSVRPGATTTYTLTASNEGGATTRTVTVTVSGTSFITPDDPGTADLRFTLHTGQAVHPISRWIYGYNGGTWDASMAPGTTLGRLGGNRWTAYNWETNASNAGSDWGPYSNDGYLSASSTPGEAVRPSVANAQAAGAGIIVTVPLQGWVSADKNGNVDVSQPVSTRFLPSQAKKGAPFSNPPSTTDGKVYQDEFVAWLDGRFPTARTDPARPIFYMLDNEPDLWNSTHLEVQRSKLRYDQLIPASIALAGAIKDVVPQALVFGPASYGWNGFVNLQDAPDAGGRDFLETYLAHIQSASSTQGRRLLDVLDLHWYSEAQGGGQRVAGGDNSAAVAAARIQAPRSLWDPAYTETSWITQWSTLGPIRLIPRMMEKIAARYPGTLLAFSEYNHGGEDHISGGLAQADTLGAFGREGVFAANLWPLTSNRAFSYGAFRLYRNYDGSGGAFGDTSFSATASDNAMGSVYGSLDAGNPARVVAVLLNKDTLPRTAGLALTHTQLFGHVEVYQLTAASPVSGGSAVPQRQADVPLTLRNALRLTLPAWSATVLVFRP